MRLSELIRLRKEAILQDFEDFARTHTVPGASMDIEALRDHAAGMLDAVALDLEQSQTDAEQERKAKGEVAKAASEGATAAEEHGRDRAKSGFSLVETFAEYRALRASVLRHWTAASASSAGSKFEDVVRFNEAIDQSLAESIHEYSRAVSEHRELFLAVLGHDLRSPLNLILNASDFLAEHAPLSERDQRLVGGIHRSGHRMTELIDDMLDYTSSKLGAPMPLNPVGSDLREVAKEIVGDSEVTHPGREFRTEFRGDLIGEWDVMRLRQALRNLIGNAVQYGAEDAPITVSAYGDEGGREVVLSVHNLGAPIPPDERERIFEPFWRGSWRDKGAGGIRRNLGLGLYIARQMAEAHGGKLEVESSKQEGTAFSVRLPRQPTA